MCKSVRGAAFFGSSLHLAFSFVFLFWFIFDTVISEININLWKCDPPEKKFSDLDPLAHYLNLLFKLFYFTALSVTGVYVFRGVERERPQILKYATLGFIILQVLGVILFSVFFSLQWNADPDSSSVTGNPETARLIASEVSITELQNLTQGSPPEKINEPDPDATSISILKNVTPIMSENVIQAPDVGIIETTTTTTPAPPVPVVPPAPTATATIPPPPPPPSEARKRLPHNQLVSLVFQMCLVIANGLGSVAYVIVLALYMLQL